jgi:O-antigen/teichoic acid export membrane protein
MREPESNSIARSTLLNFAGFLVPTIVLFVTVPLYIRTIGADRYGVMALVWLLLGYFGVFDLGFGQAIASRIAAFKIGADKAREQVFWTGTCLSVLAGAAGGFVLYVAAKRLFGGALAVPQGLLAETKLSLPLLIPALPVITGISALSGALQGREEFWRLNLSQMVGATLYQLFPLLVALSFSPHLPGLVGSAILGRLATLFMLYMFCLKCVPARPWPRIARGEILPLLGYGSWVTLSGLISPLLTVFDRFVIGAITGMAAVTAYTIPFNLVVRLGALPSSFQNALFPRFAMTEANSAHALLARSIRVLAALMTPLSVIGVIMMKPFLIIWIGLGLAGQSALVGQILMVGLWPYTMAFIPFCYLQSRGRPDLPAKFHVGELIVYAPALFFLTKYYGAAGAAWAWDARALVDAILTFAAVQLLGRVAYASFGLILICITFLWMLINVSSPVGYWIVNAVLISLSLVWSLYLMPKGILNTLMSPLEVLRRKASALEKPVD